MSAYKGCQKHGRYFGTFPECPYCVQERTAPEVTRSIRPRRNTPSPPSVVRTSPGLSSKQRVSRPVPQFFKRRRISRRKTLIFGSVILGAIGIIGIIDPFPAALLLGLVLLAYYIFK